METRRRRRHWIMVATATLNCVALGGVASVIASCSPTRLSPILSWPGTQQ